MDPKTPQTLEAIIDKELKGLPVRPAPSTLVPRVMAAVESGRRPWWHRTWRDWPLLPQTALLTFGVAAFALATGWIWRLGQQLEASWGTAAQAMAGWLDVSRLIPLPVLPWPQMGWVLYTGLAAGIFFLASMGLGTILVRVALKRC